MKKQIPHRGRKTLAGVVAMSMLCAAAIPSILTMPASGASGASGDLNGDGSVTGADVAILQDALLSRSTLTAEQYTNADVTGDGAVNGFDLAKLRQMANDNDPVSDAITIHLSDSGITVEGDTAGVTSVSGKTVTITASGNYIVDGSITDGQILVNVPDVTADAEAVSLYLQDVTMTSSTGAPCILAQSADKLKLTCGGTNTLTDTATAANEETSGVIYGDCDITFTKNSTGSLNITSSMNTAIRTKDDLKLNGGVITVNTDVDDTSDADAIRANNTLEIDGATVNIESSADGLKSSKEDVVVSSGKVSIKAGNDAIQAATAITISDGTVVASGDRGLTLDEGGALNITGGNVLATATDYAFGMTESGTALTVDTSGSTQGIVQLDYAEEWKKDNVITIQSGGSTVYEMTSNKKYDYVLASGAGLSGSGSYTVYTGGSQMTHDGSTDGTFAMNGTPTKFTGVKLLEGGSTVVTGDAVVTSLVFDGGSVTAVNASGDTVANPSNLTISGATVTITTSSEISVSGESDSAQIAVNVDKTAEPEGKVVLNLEGATLSNSSAAPIYVEAIGDEVQISAKNGTTNTISDGTSHTDTYTDSDGNTETVNGAIFSRDDLKIKGKGTLIVNGNTEDGIVCKNDLKIWNGNIQVTAVDDGIRGNDSVRIGDPDDSTNYATLSVSVTTTGGDGIKTNNTEETDKGYITVSGGTIDLNTFSDGMQADNALNINGGDINIYTYQGSSYTASGSSSSSNSNSGFGPGGGGMGTEGNSNKMPDDLSAKGIKTSTGAITITGGTITVDSSDDSIHSNGALTITGGVMNLKSADDAAHAEGDLTLGTDGGANDDFEIYVTKCYEGIEGGNIYQYSGTVVVKSDDDGYNTAGGADDSGNNNNTGWNQGGGMSGSSGNVMQISGGIAIVQAASGDHDGFDSNGPVYITGGVVIANGQEPIDCGDGYSESITGGTVAELSSQGTGSIAANTQLTIADSSGNVIVSFTTMQAAGAPSLNDSSLKVYTGGTISGGTDLITSDSDNSQTVYDSGTISGGTEVSAGNSGSWGGGGNGGGMFG